MFLLGEVNVAVISGVIARNIAYLGAYVFRSPDWAAWAFVLLLSGKLAAVFVWPPLVRSRNLAAWSAAGFAVSALVSMALACVRPQYLLMDVGLFAFGLSLGGVNQMSWALISTLVRTDSSRSFQFGVFSAVGKIGGGLSGFALGLLLGGDVTHAAMRGPVGTPLYAGAMGITFACAVIGVLCLGLLSIVGAKRGANAGSSLPQDRARVGAVV
jgi:Na+/melibiose symporter-like transporter